MDQTPSLCGAFIYHENMGRDYTADVSGGENKRPFWSTGTSSGTTQKEMRDRIVGKRWRNIVYIS